MMIMMIMVVGCWLLVAEEQNVSNKGGAELVSSFTGICTSVLVSHVHTCCDVRFTFSFLL